MFRSICLAVIVLSVVVTAVGLSAQAQHEHAASLTKCAKICSDCQLQCDSCSKHGLTLLASGKKEHAQMTQMCADCGECCKTCSTLCARESPLAQHMLECCAKCCDECAMACEKAPGDNHMAACAASCRDCAKECRALLTRLKE